MSQEQPQRPQAAATAFGEEAHREKENAPIKYRDVFPGVSGELASKPIAPQDAAMMQAAENIVLGQTQKGGPAAAMQSAAARNERAGVVGHSDITDVAGDPGITVAETDEPGRRVISESVGGQVVAEYSKPAPIAPTTPAVLAADQDALTIGEALEATAITAGAKPVDKSDAAAIQVAEMRATGSTVTVPGGIASEAQSAASVNARMEHDEDKTKLGDLLKDATTKLPMDKAVTKEDAEGVISAELRNNPTMTTYPGGVAASVAAAARLNSNDDDETDVV